MAAPRKDQDPSITIQTDSDNMSQVELDANMRTRMTVARKRRAAQVRRYQKEKTRTVILAPSYQSYWGRVMVVSINGAVVSVPVDGQPYEVPETFACEIDRRRVAADKIELNAKNAAEVSRNRDEQGSPGRLVPRGSAL